MEKETRNVRGKFQFLLGKKNDELYWLEQASFDCDWYWGIGYVESYHGHGRADKSWRGHQHFDGLFLDGPKDCKTMFDNFFDECPLTDREKWDLLELMSAAYKARRYADMLHIGGSHITANKCSDIIKNDAEYERINNQVIPSIMNAVYKLMMSDAYTLEEVEHS